ncbi:MAG: hypothetical protein AAF352_07815, partial [Pseudomonadota bacterium]
MKIGILPLGRDTFDVEFANEKLAGMLRALDVLDGAGHEIVGARSLLFDAQATQNAIADLQSQAIEYLMVLQVTFTDASMTVLTASAFDCPLGIWAVPEPRIGGRLRLNAFCGLNLASHALGRNHQKFSWLYADPTRNVAQDLAAMLAGVREISPLSGQKIDAIDPEAT